MLERTDLDRLQFIGADELVFAANITQKQAQVITAATAYAKRIRANRPPPVPDVINCPEDVVNLLQPVQNERTQEELHVLLLTVRNKGIAHHMPYRLTVTAPSSAPPRSFAPQYSPAHRPSSYPTTTPPGTPTPAPPILP